MFVDKPYQELTKEELRSMLRVPDRVEPIEFINYYGIPKGDYCRFIRSKGLAITRPDRKIHSDYLDELKKQENADVKKNSLYYDWTDIDNIPKALICAIYEVDFDEVDGKFLYDIEQFTRAKEDLSNKLHNFNEKFKKKEKYSKLRPIDLIAMRIFRGYNRKGFSKLSGLPISEITFYESKTSKVPKIIEKAYTEHLNIKERHIVQLREILTGKSKQITDNREIPKFIKLRVWKRDNGKCVKCGTDNKLHYHHIKRFSEGGQHTEENIQLLCVSCHAEEHKGEKGYYMLKKMAEG